MRRVATIACVVTLVCSAASRAEYIIIFSQVGPNVVATGSGSIDLAALSAVGNTFGTPFVNPSHGDAYVGSGGAPGFGPITGPTSFGPGGANGAAVGTGQPTGVVGVLGEVLVPPGYTSGDPLSGTATWPGTTFAGLGLTPGIYTWTWGSGADADSFVVDIGVPLVTPIPEPSTLLVAGMALGVVGCGAWMRRWRAAAVAA